MGEWNEPVAGDAAEEADDHEDEDADDVPLMITFIRLVDALPFISRSESISLLKTTEIYYMI